MTKLEQLIGDLDILHTVLEGFLANWKGTFDVRPADIPNPTEYLFNPKHGFAELCQKMKSTPAYEKHCIRCDARHAQEARQQNKPIHYICYAGLVDIAVPIIVEGELIATIFCGQCRSTDPNEENLGRARTTAIAAELRLVPEELLALREKARAVTNAEIEEAKQRLWKVANYMAAVGYEKLRLLELRNRMTRESEQIQNVMNTLSTIVDVGAFWPNFDYVLSRIRQTIGALYGAVFVVEEGGPFRLESMTGLQRELFRDTYAGDTASFHHAVRGNKYSIANFDSSAPNSFAEALAACCQRRPQKVTMIPFELSRGSHALMVFFFLEKDRDLHADLPMEKEAEILLSKVAPQVAASYQNCVLYTQRKRLAAEKDIFIQDVAHQLIAPLSGIQADSDRLFRYIGEWDRDRVNNQVLAIRGMSRSAARLARNLMWVSATGGHTLQRKRPTKLTGLLIACAIDVQGIAAYRSVRVTVNNASTDALPEIRLDRETFMQVVVNLLDNAVKYSSPHTEVTIDASYCEGFFYIRVINYGIEIREADIERIFERGERMPEARELVPGGTGIGLYVAREIVSLHGGTLSVAPSVCDADAKAHRVVFTIKLPAR